MCRSLRRASGVMAYSIKEKGNQTLSQSAGVTLCGGRVSVGDRLMHSVSEDTQYHRSHGNSRLTEIRGRFRISHPEIHDAT